MNVPDDSSEASFLTPQMSVKNVYNFDAPPWPKNTILIAEDSMINVSTRNVSLQTLNHLKSDVSVES